MTKTANINVRIDPEFKAEVEKLYNRFGISVTDAINIFLHVSLMEGGLPFEVRQPRYNAAAETRSSMDSSAPADSVDDLFADALDETDRKNYCISRVGDVFIAYPKTDPWAPVREAINTFSSDFMADRNQPNRRDTLEQEDL